uniref:protein-disulfide reductase DsbD family protein n=1 Tax=Flavobacterium sp. TaxID=239 RepID=UPI0040493A16
MKKQLIPILIFLASLGAYAQILEPVKWKASVEKTSDTEFTLVMEASIENEWHMYSQFTPEGGTLPMLVTHHKAGEKYELVGKTEESETTTEYNEIFMVDEVFFSKTAVLTQKYKVLDKGLKSINVELEYQACKESCILLYNYFTVDVATMTVQEVKGFEDEPEEKAVSETKSEKTTDNTTDEPDEQKGLWTIFIAAFFSGFAALLTPCVFPMIPMTVSFFTKQSKNRAKGIRNAIFYGISIIIIYVALGSLITGIFGADALNELSTSVTFNMVFFVLLVFFAASFLGAFEIVLPNSWANKIDKQADRGGFIGIFFMALALAIVSFSCTGPIVGTLLVEAASKGGLAPIIGMLGFSSALALPFVLFALFPGMMNSLPKSGGWLNTVKVSLGFLELAFAFKFLSNADLVLQAHLLEREVFLAIWIAIFGIWALYLFGKISLPHDSPMSHISVGRLFMALFVLTFTIYLVPGLWGAPLKIISGFPPAMKYSESPYGVGNSKGGIISEQELPAGAYLGPHDIIAFHEYEDGLAYAKEINKPILLDFTGYACVNCRKMEEQVWSEPEILKILKEEVVLISLYVDDKKELPKSEQYVSPETGKKIKTVGNKWSDFQITRYKANAQPYYILLDLDENQLSDKPASYDPDIELYEQWLREGIDKF